MLLHTCNFRRGFWGDIGGLASCSPLDPYNNLRILSETKSGGGVGGGVIATVLFPPPPPLLFKYKILQFLLAVLDVEYDYVDVSSLIFKITNCCQLNSIFI